MVSRAETASLRVAIVTDWLTTYGGAEKVVKSIHELYPDAPIFTSQYAPGEINWFDDCDVRTGWVNLLPARLRKILTIPRALYFSRLHRKLRDYDLIITVCTAESKGIKLAPHQTGVCYLQGPPTQYFWGMYDAYIENPGFGRLNGIVRCCFKVLVRPLRRLDYAFAQRPTVLVANSSYSAAETEKYYHRQARVVFPPVEVAKFQPLKALESDASEEPYYITTSRQVNWKRLDVAIQACLRAGRRLVLVGDGAEHAALRALAGDSPLIRFIPRIDDPVELNKLVARARGFIFPSIEPFGIAPIEALSAGVPVIALREGGALDYIQPGDNGWFFTEQTADSLVAALVEFEQRTFSPSVVRSSAQRFANEHFKQSITEVISDALSGDTTPRP